MVVEPTAGAAASVGVHLGPRAQAHPICSAHRMRFRESLLEKSVATPLEARTLALGAVIGAAPHRGRVSLAL